jgi:integrase
MTLRAADAVGQGSYEWIGSYVGKSVTPTVAVKVAVKEYRWVRAYVDAASFVARHRRSSDRASFDPLIPPASLSELSVFQIAGPPPPESSLAVDQPIPKDPTVTTPSEWWAEDTEKWSNWVDWVSKPTRADYLRHLRTIPEWLVRLGFERPTNAHAFTAEMVMGISWDRSRSGSTRQKALVVLKSYIAWKQVPLALNKRLWKEAMDVDTRPDPTRRKRLTPAEVVRLTRSAARYERWAIVVALALWNGLRQGEIRELRVEDLDFENHRVHVWYGKGKKDRHPKMSTPAEGLLEPLRRLEDPYEPVYPYGRTTLARDLWDCCDDANIARRAPHDLRASCAKNTKAGGATPYGRQLLLGHARAEQTRLYEGEDDLELQDAVDKLSAWGERILEEE